MGNSGWRAVAWRVAVIVGRPRLAPSQGIVESSFERAKHDPFCQDRTHENAWGWTDRLRLEHRTRRMRARIECVPELVLTLFEAQRSSGLTEREVLPKPRIQEERLRTAQVSELRPNIAMH